MNNASELLSERNLCEGQEGLWERRWPLATGLCGIKEVLKPLALEQAIWTLGFLGYSRFLGARLEWWGKNRQRVNDLLILRTLSFKRELLRTCSALRKTPQLTFLSWSFPGRELCCRKSGFGETCEHIVRTAESWSWLKEACYSGAAHKTEWMICLCRLGKWGWWGLPGGADGWVEVCQVHKVEEDSKQTVKMKMLSHGVLRNMYCQSPDLHIYLPLSPFYFIFKSPSKVELVTQEKLAFLW